MEITSINSKLLARMFLAGAKNLDSKKDWINELNVFPVPDGDTGTNMTMTIMSGRACKGYFIRLFKRCQRKLGCYLITAFQRLLQGYKGIR